MIAMKRAGLLAFGLAIAAGNSLSTTDFARAAATEKKEELSETYRGSQARNVEYQKIAPFKVFDNLYYVGPGFVSVWLIPTNNGIILLDTAQEPYVDHVIGNIQKAGFSVK